MPKTSFDQAMQSNNARHAFGVEAHNEGGGQHKPQAITLLEQLCATLDSYCELTSESTTAAGLMGNNLYIAQQAGKKGKREQYVTTNRQTILQTFNITGNIYDCTFSGKIDYVSQVGMMPDKILPSGLHAEMMIIRFIVLTQGVPKMSLAASDLYIATSVSKGCCLDCAGFLNQYHVPHTATNGKPSLKWRHPISLSEYRHANAVDNVDNLLSHKAPMRNQLN